MYKYEMHMHSAPCSGGGDDILSQIDVLISRGYSGMVLTDHFYGGDTRVDRALPWDEFVECYRTSYERGRKYGEERDFDVLFGIEEHIGKGLEVLIYGITPDLLLEHPELSNGKIEDYIRIVHGAGGLIFQAHPYREARYIVTPGPVHCLDELDGIEVFNASNKPEANALASSLAKERSLRCVAGSDAHACASCGRAGIASPVRLKTPQALVKQLLCGDYEIIRSDG